MNTIFFSSLLHKQPRFQEYTIDQLRFLISNRPHFLWVYRRDNQRGMLGEHDFTSFSSVLPASQAGYHADKPIESVVYCFYEMTLSFLWVYQHKKL